MITTLSASTVKLLQQALKQWLSPDKKNRVQIKTADTSCYINLDQASPELLKKIQELLVREP
jgi:hypothetical protein